MTAGWKQQSYCLSKHKASHGGPQFFLMCFSNDNLIIKSLIWNFFVFYVWGACSSTSGRYPWFPSSSCLCIFNNARLVVVLLLPFQGLSAPSLPLYSDYNCSSGGLVSSSLDCMATQGPSVCSFSSLQLTLHCAIVHPLKDENFTWACLCFSI